MTQHDTPNILLLPSPGFPWMLPTWPALVGCDEVLVCAGAGIRPEHLAVHRELAPLLVLTLSQKLLQGKKGVRLVEGRRAVVTSMLSPLSCGCCHPHGGHVVLWAILVSKSQIRCCPVPMQTAHGAQAGTHACTAAQSVCTDTAPCNVYAASTQACTLSFLQDPCMQAGTLTRLQAAPS